MDRGAKSKFLTPTEIAVGAFSRCMYEYPEISKEDRSRMISQISKLDKLTHMNMEALALTMVYMHKMRITASDPTSIPEKINLDVLTQHIKRIPDIYKKRKSSHVTTEAMIRNYVMEIVRYIYCVVDQDYTLQDYSELRIQPFVTEEEEVVEEPVTVVPEEKYGEYDSYGDDEEDYGADY